MIEKARNADYETVNLEGKINYRMRFAVICALTRIAPIKSPLWLTMRDAGVRMIPRFCFRSLSQLQGWRK